MTVSSLNQLFKHELEDMYFAEQELVGTLEEFEGLMQNQELREAVREHREHTEQHVDRLEQVFELIGEPPEEETCEGMEGLLEEHREFRAMDPDDAALELFTLIAIHKTEHYEIASYGNLALIANRLGLEEAAQLLHDNLEEEEWFLNDLKRFTDEYDFDQLATAA